MSAPAKPEYLSDYLATSGYGNYEKEAERVNYLSKIIHSDSPKDAFEKAKNEYCDIFCRMEKEFGSSLTRVFFESAQDDLALIDVDRFFHAEDVPARLDAMGVKKVTVSIMDRTLFDLTKAFYKAGWAIVGTCQIEKEAWYGPAYIFEKTE